MKIKTIASLCSLFTLSIFSGSALALCTANSETVILNGGKISIPLSAPVGDVLATGSAVSTASCTNSGGTGVSWNAYMSGSNVDYGATNLSEVRKTNLPGIGIRWSNTNGNTMGTLVMTKTPLNDTYPQRGISLDGNTVLTDNFQLVKIGDIPSGVWPAMTINMDYRTNSGVSKGLLYTITLPSVIIQQVGCNVLNKTIPVSMGRISRDSFKGIGTVAQENKFSIPMMCEKNTQIKVTLDSVNTAADITKGVLALTPDSTAAGVGVQLQYNSVPVVLGSPINYGTTKTLGNVDIPFTARYYQTQSNVTAGTANAQATFTLTYQ